MHTHRRGTSREWQKKRRFGSLWVLCTHSSFPVMWFKRFEGRLERTSVNATRSWPVGCFELSQECFCGRVHRPKGTQGDETVHFDICLYEMLHIFEYRTTVEPLNFRDRCLGRRVRGETSRCLSLLSPIGSSIGADCRVLCPGWSTAFRHELLSPLRNPPNLPPRPAHPGGQSSALFSCTITSYKLSFCSVR